MLWMGLAFLVIGLIGAGIKGSVVWSAAHDIYNGGGAPTLDFAFFWPIPIAIGGSIALTGVNHYPFSGFGFVLYGLLIIAFGGLQWLFYKLGAPERQRQLSAILARKQAGK